MPGLALLWRKIRKLRFPKAQNVGLESGQFAHLAYFEKQLVRDLLLRPFHEVRDSFRPVRCLIIIGVPVNGYFCRIRFSTNRSNEKCSFFDLLENITNVGGLVFTCAMYLIFTSDGNPPRPRVSARSSSFKSRVGTRTNRAS